MEVATAFLYPFLSPQLLREEEEETIKTLEKIYSGIIRVMVLMNQSKGFTVFLFEQPGFFSSKGKTVDSDGSEVVGSLEILSSVSSRLYSLKFAVS